MSIDSDIIGREIDGFLIQSVLGKGGMGAVYRAENVMLGRTVALKVFDQSLAQQEELARRFRVEAQVMARLSHPNIVQAYELRESELGPFIVMEYVEGRTLSEYMHLKGPMPWQQAVPLIRQMLSALAYAHDQGVIHRDIKGRNLMLTREGNIKVMDFGLAKVLAANYESITKTMSRGGTLYYMSPEQVRSLKNVDHRTDIYSLGMTLYQLFCGRLPFDKNDSAFTILRAIVEDRFPPLHQFNTQLPPALDAFVMKALEKDPADRYQSAEEMLVALNRLDDSPVSQTFVKPLQSLGEKAQNAASKDAVSKGLPSIGAASKKPAPKPPPPQTPTPPNQSSKRRTPNERAQRRAALLAARKRRKRVWYGVLLAGLLLVGALGVAVLAGVFDGGSRASSSSSGGATPAAEPSASVSTGELRLRVLPSAYLTVDGEQHSEVAGSQYATISLPVGRHVLTLQHPEHGRWEEEVVVSSSQTRTIEVDFQRMITLRVTATDRQGQVVRGVVFVDGEAQGTVPRDLRVRPGLHRIEVRRQGYQQMHLRETGMRQRMYGGDRPALNFDQRSDGSTLTAHMRRAP